MNTRSNHTKLVTNATRRISSSKATLVALICALSAACGADPDDPADCEGDSCDKAVSCENGGEYGNGVCDLSCTTPDIDCFEVYSEWDEAAENYRGFVTDNLPNAPALIDGDDPRSVQVQKLVDTGWAEYAELRGMNYLPAPTVLLLDSEEVNAFVARTALDPNDAQVSWSVVVYLGITLAPFTEEMQTSVIFHELEHGASMHSLGEIGKETRRFYVNGAQDFEPGFSLATDEALQALGNRWFGNAGIIGGYSLAQMGALTSNSSNLGKAVSILAATGESIDCFGMEIIMESVTEILNGSSVFASPLTSLSAEQLEEIEGFGAEYETTVATCFEGDTRSLLEALSEASSTPIDLLLEKIDEELLASLEGLSLAEQILAFGHYLHSQQLGIQEGFQELTGETLNSLRYYSTEEEADDSATRLMVALGMDPKILGDFLIAGYGEEELEVCKEMLRDNVEPPYGDLADEHHSSCWRAHHIARFEEFLEQGGQPRW